MSTSAPETTQKREFCAETLGAHSPITTPALAPGLSDFRAAPMAAVPVVLVVPPVVHVVIAGAGRSGDLEEAGTAPIDPKPGKNA